MDTDKENRPARRSSASTVQCDYLDATGNVTQSNRESTDSYADNNLIDLMSQLEAQSIELEVFRAKDMESENKISTLTEAVSSLEGDLAVLQDIIGQCGDTGGDQADERVVALQKDLSELQQVADTATQLRSQLASLQETIDAMESALREAKECVKASDSLKIDAERALEVAESELMKVNECSQVAAESVAGEMCVLKESCSAAEVAREHAVRSLEATQAQLEASREAAEFVEAERSAYEESLAAKEERIAVLETEAVLASELLVEKEERIVSIELALSTADNHGQHFTSEIQNLMDEMEEKQSELTRLHEELRAAIEERDGLMQEVEKSCEQVQDLTEALVESEALHIEERDIALQEAEGKAVEALAQKEEQMQQLVNEIELLKAELSTVNESIADDMHERQLVKESSEAEIAELVARLEIAAQELTAQQKDLDHMKEERERMNSDRNGSVMTEMNALVEGKIEAEARALKAERDSKELQDQLSSYDRNTAEEQEIIMQVAEKEIKQLQANLEISSAELAASLGREGSLTARCTELEATVSAREHSLIELENALSSKGAEVDADMEDALRSAEDARDAAISDLKVAERELVKVTESSKCAAVAASAECSALENAIEVKDQRIAHLELSKLTQDQMDKIKLLKEEHKKSKEDVKTMKKQLTQLKKAYDDLKDTSLSGPAASNSSVVAAAHMEIASLTAQLHESRTRLESVQNVAKSLKDKIRDCSKQLQVCRVHAK